MDNELIPKERIAIEEHLAECFECADVFEDLSLIQDTCHQTAHELESPPNSQALWLRISNLVESEREIAVKEAVVEKAKPQSAWKRFWEANWQFSFSQIASGLIGVVVISSLLTVIGIQNFSTSPTPANASVEPSLFDKFLVNVGLNGNEAAQLEQENRYKQQLMAIEYWNQRVEMRRKQWKPDIRAAFDRNLQELNQVVIEYNEKLKQNPDDKLSEEMLDSTLSEKMELLREFSEL